MALDLQRNWDASMAENLRLVMRSKDGGGTPLGEPSLKETKKQGSPISKGKLNIWTTPPVFLPDEILLQILEYVSKFRESQYTLASCCLLSRQWYSASVPFLYASPHLEGKNFDPFVRTISPSINRHVQRSALADLVKVLNMRTLVHQGSKSVTARLLGRTQNNLEAFVAPVASFAINCFAALSKCHELRFLDLSLVSESPPLLDLLRKVSHLEHLITFKLPRSSGFAQNVDPSHVVWPPNLEDLSLSGGIDAHFLYGVVSFPSTLRSLTIEHCPLAKGSAVIHMLRTVARCLPRLEILRLANLPRLNSSSLDNVLYLLPGLTRLSVSVDYITPAIFDFDVGSHTTAISEEPCVDSHLSAPVAPRHQWLPGQPCRLRTLELTNSGNPGVEDKISPIDILIAIDEGVLPALRHVRVAKSLLWHSSPSAGDVDALVDALQESAIKQGEPDGKTTTGVWTFEG